MAAIIGILTLVYLSLAPVYVMLERPGYPRPVEHFVAYAVIWMLTALAFSKWSVTSLVLAVVTIAGVLEILQSMSPGRTPAFADFLGSASGGVLGLFVGHFLHRLSVRVRPLR